MAIPLLAGALVWGAVLWFAGNPAAEIAVRVDLDVNGGAFVELFVNDFSQPLRRPVISGRQTYEFTTPQNPVTLIRVDPTDASAVSVRLHSLEIVAPDGRVLSRFGPNAFEQWNSQGLGSIDKSTDVLAFRSASNDPMLIGQFPPVGIPVATGRAAFAWRLQHEPWLACVLLLPLLSLVEVRPWGPWLLRTAALTGVMTIWPLIFRAFARVDWGETPSTVAISRAAFLGISLPSTQMAITAGFAAAGLVGLIIALGRSAAASDSRPPAAVSGAFVVLIWLAAILVTAPDLAASLGWYKSLRYSPQWDSDNLLTWGYWTAAGHLPFRDFWYPYGGQFLFDKPWPVGPLLSWAAAAGRYAVFASALALASGGRRGAALLATVALIALMDPATPRYLMGANIVLAYVAASRSQFHGRLGLVTLAVALVMALVFETVQLVYAIPAVAVIAGMDVLKQQRLGTVWRGPALCAAVLLVACVPLFAALAAHGMLTEALTFHITLADAVQYSALPATIEPAWWRWFAIGDIAVLFPAGVLLLGLIEYKRSDLQARVRASALVGLGAAHFIVLQKHLVRPLTETLVLYAVLVGLAFGVLSPAARVSRYRIGLGAAAGLLVAILTVTGRGADSWAIATRIPTYVTGTVRTLLNSGALAEANRERFAPERFDLYGVERTLVTTLTSRRGDAVRLFALSDDPILYVFSGQLPVWQTNLYNTSLWYEQERVVAALRNAPPDYIVAIPSRLTFDLVPVAVRNPDIVAFAVDHFVPDAPADPYVVLRPRREGEPVQPAFWRDLLGDRLDLGMLALSLANAEYQPCAPSVACEELLVLTATGPVGEGRGSIGLDCDGSRVDVVFGLKPNQRRYVIPLSRLWPGVAARAAGRSIEVVDPGMFTVERTAAARPPGRLY